MNDFDREALALGLKKLFAASFFDICAFDTLVELAQVVVDSELRRSLRAIHCVHWGTMRPEFRAEVARRVVAALSSGAELPEVRITATGVELVEQRLPWLAKLIGGRS